MEHADGHRYFEGLAVAHVLGGLDDSEGRVFRAHLLECGSCRARVGELRAIAHDLADVERDERRVRAAQAIDTKRRETEDEVDVTVEPMPSPRSSRITVVVGLILIIGLSLWNFTLRSAMTLQDAQNRDMQEVAIIANTGDVWQMEAATGVEASVKSVDERLVVVASGLDPKQLYGLYMEDAAGTVTRRETPPVDADGRIFQPYELGKDAEPSTIILTNPSDTAGVVGKPGREATGVRVFEATPPLD